MMLINGRVVGESLDGGNVVVGCKETCYNLTNCILAFMDSHNHCILYDFNSTIQLEIEETEEPLFVAFKTWLPSDSCPIYSEMIPVVKIGEDTIPWTKTSNTFNFLKCVGDWKMFQRPSGITVCMQTFHKPPEISRNEAVQYCEGMGYKLIGVESVEEIKWIYNYTTSLYPSDVKFKGLWIDGIRDCGTSYGLNYPTPCVKGPNPPADCQKFTSNDGFTVSRDIYTSIANFSQFNWADDCPEDCLVVTRTFYSYEMVNDVKCDEATNVGFVCGYQLI